MQVNAVLSSTGTGEQRGKKINTTITHLRESQESKATLLAQQLNALTTNSYENTQINEMNVDPSSGTKDEPTFTLGNITYSSGAGYFTGEIEFNYTGDGAIYYAIPTGTIDSGAPAGTDASISIKTTSSAVTKIFIYVLTNFPNPPIVVTFKIYTAETENYAAKEFTFTPSIGG